MHQLYKTHIYYFVIISVAASIYVFKSINRMV